LSAPYVGHGNVALVAGGLVGRVTVTVVGADVVGGRGRAPPHETRAPAATITPITATVLAIGALSAQMAPQVGEQE
jgi:hypothetical protein